MDRPDLDAVLSRALCVLGLLVRTQLEEQLAVDPPRAHTWTGALERLDAWLRRERLEDALVPEEQALLGVKWGGWSLADASTAAWRIEGLATLLYALSRFERPDDFGAPVDTEAVYATTSLLPARAELAAGAELQPPDELERFRRMTGIWRWRARTELLHRRGAAPTTGEPYEGMVRRAAERAAEAGLVDVVAGDFAVRGAPFASVSETTLKTLAAVALERGRAAEWLCGRAPWDAPSEL